VRSRGEFGLALTLLVIGGGAGLLVSSLTWQTLSVSREPPLGNLVIDVSGRKVDSMPTALFLVALAGIVAVIATRGLWRRLVGVVLAVAGAVALWRSIAARDGLSEHHSWQIVVDKLPSVGPANDGVGVSVAQWPILSALLGAFVLVAGVLIAWRGGTWAGMSRRYDAPLDPADAAAKQNASLWTAIERGDDPTV
jgi:uncharacterized membrane protein (TIGR02234 family)